MKKLVFQAATMAILLLLLLSMSVSAWTPYDYEDAEKKLYGPFTYVVVDGEAIIYRCDKKAAGVVEIPAVIDGYPVTQINFLSFGLCKEITEVIIPNGVTKIIEGAFSDCTGLKVVTIPPSVTSIGIHAFLNCTSLETVNFSKGLKDIQMAAFGGCTSLKKIVLPEGLEFISNGVFQGCTALCDITFPKSLKACYDDLYDTKYRQAVLNWENGSLYVGSCFIDSKPTYDNSVVIRYGTTAVTPFYHAQVVYFGGSEEEWKRLVEQLPENNRTQLESQITKVHYYTNGKSPLSSISITKVPNKVEYALGETFSDAGMYVMAHYEDDSQHLITTYTVSGLKNELGEQKLTVSYGGKTAQFSVNVVKAGATTAQATTKTTTKATTIAVPPATTTATVTATASTTTVAQVGGIAETQTTTTTAVVAADVPVDERTAPWWLFVCLPLAGAAIAGVIVYMLVTKKKKIS